MCFDINFSIPILCYRSVLVSLSYSLRLSVSLSRSLSLSLSPSPCVSLSLSLSSLSLSVSLSLPRLQVEVQMKEKAEKELSAFKEVGSPPVSLSLCSLVLLHGLLTSLCSMIHLSSSNTVNVSFLISDLNKPSFYQRITL